MHKIVSLPPSLVDQFNEVSGLPSTEWFPTTDPNNQKVGSGGGTAWAIANFQQAYGNANKRIVIHAGGQSRRLPAYAPSGKVLTPIPIFKWSIGQRIDQNLLSLQTPLYEHIMNLSADNQKTLIASGDVFIYVPEMPTSVPQADVVCYGIWTQPQLASNHGVFFMSRDEQQQLDFMLQKPTHEQIEELAQSHIFLMDIGVWVLSDKALNVLMRKCGWNGSNFGGVTPRNYDLYSEFGTALGVHPSAPDDEISSLSVAIVTLEGGEFYHFGTSAELISSTEKIQNRIVDQRNIWHKKVKPQPSIFIQNSDCDYHFGVENKNIWIENSCVNSGWHLSVNNIVTGVPTNNWNITLADGQCLDIVPIGESEYCVRPYCIGDKFAGEAQFVAQYPVVTTSELTEELVVGTIANADYGKQHGYKTLSAANISEQANLHRLTMQRKAFLRHCLPILARNYKRSVFYQTDLKYTSQLCAEMGLQLPSEVSADDTPTIRMCDAMFHGDEAKAFGILHDSIIAKLGKKAAPHCNVLPDQTIWGRSPARLDIAGGWSDTPPYCMLSGGCVVNLAVELNGQMPIQVFVRMSDKKSIVMRSIDNGMREEITTYQQLSDYATVGSVFSIPKAALCLAGFHPDFGEKKYTSLVEQLNDFGGGFEITLLVAIPKGSGLGTSSILAATLLGVLSDLCGLGWNKHRICHLTLLLEQMLTTGGGWQDQYGGIFSGIKICESTPGAQNNITVKWLPNNVFIQPDVQNCWLLYYTGITRVAKNILSEIVKGMFLNECERLATLNAIRKHGKDMAEAIQMCDIDAVGAMIRRSWELNCQLDSGTTTDEIKRITEIIDPLATGYKLLGAGGGGYMLICAKNQQNAIEIRQRLEQNPPNDKARFVQMTLSNEGFQISRS